MAKKAEKAPRITAALAASEARAAVAEARASVAEARMAAADQSVVIARIDERVKMLVDRMDGFVTQEEFRPVKSIVYGLVGTVLLAIVSATIATVVIP